MEKMAMDRITPLFTATASAIGGRNGHTETSDGAVKSDLTWT
jgi:osmotically inducible protein OsmC